MRKVLAAFLIFFLCAVHVDFSLAENMLPLSLPAILLPGSAVSGETGKNTSANAFVFLNNEDTAIEGSGAFFSDRLVNITQSGSYYLCGTLQGSIVVDCPDDEKVTLILDGVYLQSESIPCILILAASKNVTVDFAQGSINILSSSYTPEEVTVDGAYDAAIFSKADLKFKGNGQAYIICENGKGINCRDDFSMQSCAVAIMADDDGLRGKDSVSIMSGKLHIESGADGIRSNNEEKEDKGVITISGGEIQISAQGDAIQAYNTLSVSGGAISCITGGGAQNAEVIRPNDDFRHGGRGWDMDRNQTSEDTESAKGLKSSSMIDISGGIIIADCLDDTLHSDLDITVSGGELTLTTGDDGIHSDNALFINGGSITITQSYEGIEAADLNITGGEIRLYASDDGLNAAGGEKDSSANFDGFGSRGGGFGMMSSTSGTMKMTGGYVVVNSDGDGIDINGDASLSGGILIVYGPQSGANGALDYDEIFEVTGGTMLAIGSSGMAQSVTGTKDAPVIAFTCRMSANTILRIEDSSGSNILTFEAPKSYSCVIYASSALQNGQEYSVYSGGSCDAETLDGIYRDGNYQNGTLLGTLTL